MCFFRRSSRVLLSIGLAVVFAVLSILRVPQIALSQLGHSLTSPAQHTLVAANTAQEVQQDFQRRFVCVQVSEEYSLKAFRVLSEEQIRTAIVRPLADKLSSCIQQNRSRLGTVDVLKLIGVVYTTQFIQNNTAAVIVVGVGQQNLQVGNQAVQSSQTSGNSQGGNSPISDPLSNGTSNGSVSNGVQVVVMNADQVDGVPATTGQTSITLVAKAQDDRGNDLSSQVIWKNKEGQTLGRGATLDYRPDTVKTETITAEVTSPDGRQNRYVGPSFTVSTADAPIAPNVKPLTPGDVKNIIGQDLERGFICFQDDASLKTKIVGGDIILGWSGRDLTNVEDPIVIDDPVQQILPPIKLGKKVAVESVLGRVPETATCFADSRILNDPSELFDKTKGKPIEKDFTPKQPVTFEKSQFISPITCEDVLADSEGMADQPGLIPNARTLCSDTEAEDLVVGARNIEKLPTLPTASIPENCPQLGLTNESLFVAKPKSLSFMEKESGVQLRANNVSQIIRTPGGEEFPCPAGDIGPVNDPLFNIPLQQYRINIINQQKIGEWSGQDNEDKVIDPNKQTIRNYQKTNRESYGIKSDAYIGFGVKPRFAGKVKFLPKFAFEAEAGATGKVIGGITLDALYVLEDVRKWTLIKVEGTSAPRIAFSIGPVPVWLSAYMQLPLILKSALGMCVREGTLGFESGLHINVKASNSGGSWQDPKSYNKPVTGGKAALEGKSKLAIEPRLQLLLYDIAGPAVSVGGEVQAQTTPPTTSLTITSPSTNQEFSSAQEIFLEASIETKARPAIEFDRRFYANIELISASELLFPPFKYELVGKKCFKTPRICALGGCIGGKEYCTQPIGVSFDLVGWLKSKFSIKAYDSNYIRMGQVKLPKLDQTSLGCPRIVWETDTQNLAIRRANQDLITNRITLPAGSLEPGKHRISAKAYSPFSLFDTKPIGASQPIELTVK